MYKIFSIAALLAAANAGPASYGATSFASFNDNHNSIQHIDSAPTAPKYATPLVAKVALPIQAAAPPSSVYHSAPVTKYAASSAPVYSAPVAKYSVPVTKYAPVPVAKLALPVAKYAASAYKPHYEEEYGPAQYEFAYVVEDPHTGDYHSQEEKRDGDHVVGQYSLHEADGTVRIVKYSDDGHGFNAVVERQGTPTPAPAYKKVVAVAAPHYSNHY